MGVQRRRLSDSRQIRSDDMTDKHTGTCFCGTVEVEVTGAPEAMGYCHCRSCRSWSAGPVNAFTLWKPENVKVTKGAEFVPGVHVNYSETVLRMKDGLPKLKDFPAELGGSGVAVPE